MKFGVREICDVVFRAKSARKIGSRQFYKNEPVLYFDSLKTSTLEGAVTTVYATGGKGNARLVAWDGERTLTFTMEDALISDLGIAILASADLIDATDSEPINVHATSSFAKEEAKLDKGVLTIELKPEDGKAVYVYDSTQDMEFNPAQPATDTEEATSFSVDYTPKTGANEYSIYVMFLKNGEVFTEPYLATFTAATGSANAQFEVKTVTDSYTPSDLAEDFANADQILIDYYVIKNSGVTQIDITPETFGGNFYIEASTLFRDQVSGVDMPAEFIIPNGKVQSNFTFSMASSGDPSTFTFTVDALPDYTRFDRSKKVLAAIQVISDETAKESVRIATDND